MKLSRKGAWVTRLITCCALALGLAGALAAGASAASAATGTGYIRLAHLSPNTPPVDVYLYSFGNPSAMVVLHHVAYGEVSPYEAVSSGEYTVAGMGPLAGIRLQVIDDSLAMTQNAALARVIQASMHQTDVTVTAGSKILGRHLNFTTVTRYRSVHAGTVTVHAVGTTEHGSAQFRLAPDTIYTFVVLDNSGELKVDALVDSAGSKIMPAGGTATGFGGTAARPGAPLLPWIGAAAAGLLIAAGGTIGLRRRRRPAMHAR